MLDLTLGLFYFSCDGIHFKACHNIQLQKAAGICCADFEEDGEGARPMWGISLNNLGLDRFEFIWI